MSNEIKIFESPEFGEIRTVQFEEETWFVGKDICKIFNDSNHNRSIGRLDENDKMLIEIETNGGKQEVTVVNESGLYALLFAMQPQKANKAMSDAYPPETQKMILEKIKNRTEKVRKFKHWVTSEIIPSIRKHGAYMTDETLEKALLSPDFLIRLATELKTEKEKRIAAENKIKADEPKVAFADKVADASNLIDIGLLSKLANDENIDIGRNKLFTWLRENKLLQDSEHHKNEPYQKYIDQGIFKVKEYTYDTPYGQKCGTKTYVTGKGQIYIIEKLRKAFC